MVFVRTSIEEALLLEIASSSACSIVGSVESNDSTVGRGACLIFGSFSWWTFDGGIFGNKGVESGSIGLQFEGTSNNAFTGWPMGFAKVRHVQKLFQVSSILKKMRFALLISRSYTIKCMYDKEGGLVLLHHVIYRYSPVEKVITKKYYPFMFDLLIFNSKELLCCLLVTRRPSHRLH